MQNERDDAIDNAISAVEALNEQCADEIETLDPENPAVLMHRHHRQAYIKVLTALEQCRTQPIAFAGVRPERLQSILVTKVIEYLVNGGPWPLGSQPWHLHRWQDDLIPFFEWIQQQIEATAQLRSSTLPI